LGVAILTAISCAIMALAPEPDFYGLLPYVKFHNCSTWNNKLERKLCNKKKSYRDFYILEAHRRL
ncbi:MAG: hypothetical protein AAF478_05075, partial [Pseudomonadota bacterium]